jgi:flagellar hook assembly protein FlgD
LQTTILNLAGRPVATLPEQNCAAGTTTLLWSGRSAQGTLVPSGTYLLRVTAHGADGSQASVLANCNLRR